MQAFDFSKLEAAAARNTWRMEAIRAVAIAVLSIAGASWTARGILSGYDTRLTVVENKVQGIQTDTAETIKEIHDDLREIRGNLYGATHK